MKIAKKGFFWVAVKYATMHSLNRSGVGIRDNEMAENLTEILFWFLSRPLAVSAMATLLYAQSLSSI
jgi:hypothetical protein